MKNYKVKTIVKSNFNDSRNNNKPYEAGDDIILDRGRYEELFSKGLVEKGEVIKEKVKKDEDNN